MELQGEKAGSGLAFAVFAFVIAGVFGVFFMSAKEEPVLQIITTTESKNTSIPLQPSSAASVVVETPLPVIIMSPYVSSFQSIIGEQYQFQSVKWLGKMYEIIADLPNTLHIEMYRLHTADIPMGTMYVIRHTDTSMSAYESFLSFVKAHPDPKISIMEGTVHELRAFYYKNLDQHENVRIVCEVNMEFAIAFDIPSVLEQSVADFMKTLPH